MTMHGDGCTPLPASTGRSSIARTTPEVEACTAADGPDAGGAGDDLALQDAFADGHDGFGGCAAVLAQREHELPRHEAASNRGCRGGRFVGGQQDAAGQVLLEDVINHGAAPVASCDARRPRAAATGAVSA